MKAFLLVAILFSLPVLAEQGREQRLLHSVAKKPGSVSEKKQLRLYDAIHHAGVKVTKGQPLLPYRVYLVPSPEAPNQSGYVLTDGYGELPEPLEIIRGESILSGEELGAKYPSQNYELTGEGTWIPTSKLEHYYYWVIRSPRIIKTVNWRPLEGTAPVDDTREFRELELYDGRLQRATTSLNKSDLLPLRIYRARGGASASWHFALTDAHRHPPKPAEWLMPGTVVPARLLGLTEDLRYELNEEGQWKPSLKKERYQLYSPAIPGKLKVIDFVPPRHS